MQTLGTAFRVRAVVRETLFPRSRGEGFPSKGQAPGQESYSARSPFYKIPSADSGHLHLLQLSGMLNPPMTMMQRMAKMPIITRTEATGKGRDRPSRERGKEEQKGKDGS